MQTEIIVKSNERIKNNDLLLAKKLQDEEICKANSGKINNNSIISKSTL